MPRNITPADFNCPITREIMSNPVRTPYGHTFEAEAILAWLSSHNTCPLTRNILTAQDLTVDHELRAAIGLVEIPDQAFETPIRDNVPQNLLALIESFVEQIQAIGQLFDRSVFEEAPESISANGNPLLLYSYTENIRFRPNTEGFIDTNNNIPSNTDDNSVVNELNALLRDNIEIESIVTVRRGANLTPQGVNFLNAEDEATYNVDLTRFNAYRATLADGSEFRVANSHLNWDNTQFLWEESRYNSAGQRISRLRR